MGQSLSCCPCHVSSIRVPLNMWQQISKLDLFPKTAEDFRLRTFMGGAISLAALVIFLALVTVEFTIFVSQTRLDKELRVDSSLDRKLEINLDITFPSLP